MRNRIAERARRLIGAATQVARDPQASLRQIRRGLRASWGVAWGVRGYPAAWIGTLRPRDALAEAVSELLIIGFYGANARSPSARLLARQMRRGEVGGVFFVTQNIGSRAELDGLVALFRAPGRPPLIAIDHEGGVVQRLTPAHGVGKLAHPLVVAQTLTPAEARAAYARAGAEVAALGFNVNLGPVLDLHDPANFAIGRLRRSFGTAPEIIATYGTAFVAGFSAAGMLCAAKHFPGHGHSSNDSHRGVADISDRWHLRELDPYVALLASDHPPDLVMTGHLSLKSLDPDGRAATISAAVVQGLLRGRLGFEGVIMTDDIDMEALSQRMGRREALVAALAAGNDLIMIKNLFGHDPLLPQRAVGWVRRAIAEGVLTEAQIFASAARVRRIREKLASGR